MMKPKAFVPTTGKPVELSTPWYRKMFLPIFALLAFAVAAIVLLGLRTGVAQIPPAGGGYEGGGYGADYGSGGYGEESGGYGYGGEYMGEMGSDSMMSMGSGSMMPESGGRQALLARVSPLVSRLRKAEDDDQTKAIRKELSGILGDYFDQDLERRLTGIASIEGRVKRLRDQCEQRKQAKEEILQLQLKVLENQAVGLGFFGQAAAEQGMGMNMGGSMGMGAMGGASGAGYGAPGGMGGFGPGAMPGYGGMGGGMGAAYNPIPQAFQKRTALDFYAQPLEDVLDDLRDCSGANIYVDQQELKRARIKLDQPVTIALQDVSVATAMDLITASLSNRLGVRYDDGIAVISPLAEPTAAQQNQWGNDGSQRSQDALRLLSGTGDYDFLDLPLVDVVDFLRDAASVNVFLNEHSLQGAGVSCAAPVSINLKNVKHRTALRLILDSVGKSLYFSIVDGIVVIAAIQPTPAGAEPGYYPYNLQPPPDGEYVEDAEQEKVQASLIPLGLEMGGGPSAAASTSGAEELAILEATVRAAIEKQQLVEAAFGEGQTSALELAAARGDLDIATKRLAKAKRENAAQEQLLDLELRRARLELDAAKATLEENVEINQKSPATIPSSTIKKMELVVQSAELDVERAQMLLDLHRKPADDDTP